MELCSWLPHYLIRRFLQNILHLHLERQQKAVGPNLMMTCNGESVSVYHVIAYPASIITRPIITTLTSCLHRQFQSLLWSIYTVNSSVLHNIRNSLARALQPFLPYFFPRNALLLIFLSGWWTRRMFRAWRGLTRALWNMNIHKNKISRKLLEHVSVLTPTTNYLHQACPRFSNISKYFFRSNAVR